MIQERFSLVDSSEICTQTSVSTGWAMQDTNTPTIQVSTPRSGQSSLNTFNNTCPIDFYVNGVETFLPEDRDTYGAATYDGSNVYQGYVAGPNNVFISWWDSQWGNSISITTTDSGFSTYIR